MNYGYIVLGGTSLIYLFYKTQIESFNYDYSKDFEIF